MSFPAALVAKRRLEAFIIGLLFLTTVIVLVLLLLNWDLTRQEKKIPQNEILVFHTIYHYLVSNEIYKGLNLITIATAIFLPLIVGEAILSLSISILEIMHNKVTTEEILKNIEKETSSKRIRILNIAPNSNIYLSLEDLSYLNGENSYLLQEAITMRKNSEFIFSIVVVFFLTSPLLFLTILFYTKYKHQYSLIPFLFLLLLPISLFYLRVLMYIVSRLIAKLLAIVTKITKTANSISSRILIKGNKNKTNTQRSFPYYHSFNKISFPKIPKTKISIVPISQILALLSLGCNLSYLLSDIINKAVAISIGIAVILILGFLLGKAIGDYVMSNIYIYQLSKARREQRAEED